MDEWSEAEQHAQRGRQLYEAGQWDRALNELRLAVRHNPYQAEWHFGMGLVLDAMHRYREAAQAFEHALNLRGEDTETLMRLGVDLVRSGRPNRAVEVLERTSQLDAECEPAYCYRILAHAQRGDHQQAELMFYMARQVVDECPQCYDHLAQSLAQRGDLTRAIWCWQQTLRLHRTALEVHRKLADAHCRLGQHDRARRELLAYLRLRPHDIDVLMSLGRLLTTMSRYADASERFRQVVALNPSYAEAHQQLGELALQIGHLDAAAHRLRRAEQLEPNRPGLNHLKAEVARREGRLEDCRTLLAKEVEGARRPDRPERVLSVARAMLEVEMADAAIALLTPQLESGAVPGLPQPDQRATALIYRGVAHLLTGRLMAGIRDCRAALREAPAHPAALQNLVLANLEAGRWRHAAVWLRRARRFGAWGPAMRRLRYRLWRQRLPKWWPGAHRETPRQTAGAFKHDGEPHPHDKHLLRP